VKIANLVFNAFTHDSRVLKESVSLGKHGYNVTVVAHGDKGLEVSEKLEHFSIQRLAYLDRSATKSFIKKLLVYLSYLKQSIHYVKHMDIIHCNDLNTLPVGFVVKRFYNSNVKVIYDTHEYQSEVSGLSGLKKVLVKLSEKVLIGYADRVITVSDA
jgi:glycosyltransferase involved in cell wall biosynthesis